MAPGSVIYQEFIHHHHHWFHAKPPPGMRTEPDGFTNPHYARASRQSSSIPSLPALAPVEDARSNAPLGRTPTTGSRSDSHLSSYTRQHDGTTKKSERKGKSQHHRPGLKSASDKVSVGANDALKAGRSKTKRSRQGREEREKNRWKQLYYYTKPKLHQKLNPNLVLPSLKHKSQGGAELQIDPSSYEFVTRSPHLSKAVLKKITGRNHQAAPGNTNNNAHPRPPGLKDNEGWGDGSNTWDGEKLRLEARLVDEMEALPPEVPPTSPVEESEEYPKRYISKNHFLEEVDDDFRKENEDKNEDKNGGEMGNRCDENVEEDEDAAKRCKGSHSVQSSKATTDSSWNPTEIILSAAETIVQGFKDHADNAPQRGEGESKSVREKSDKELEFFGRAFNALLAQLLFSSRPLNDEEDTIGADAGTLLPPKQKKSEDIKQFCASSAPLVNASIHEGKEHGEGASRESSVPSRDSSRKEPGDDNYAPIPMGPPQHMKQEVNEPKHDVATDEENVLVATSVFNILKNVFGGEFYEVYQDAECIIGTRRGGHPSALTHCANGVGDLLAPPLHELEKVEAGRRLPQTSTENTPLEFSGRNTSNQYYDEYGQDEWLELELEAEKEKEMTMRAYESINSSVKKGSRKDRQKEEKNRRAWNKWLAENQAFIRGRFVPNLHRKATFNDREWERLVWQTELQNAIVELSKLDPVDALRRALVIRCGSLEKAFNAMDSVKSRQLTYSKFSKGLKDLEIDVEKITRMTDRDLFRQLDDEKKGTINLHQFKGPDDFEKNADTMQKWLKYLAKTNESATVLERDPLWIKSHISGPQSCMTMDQVIAALHAEEEFKALKSSHMRQLRDATNTEVVIDSLKRNLICETTASQQILNISLAKDRDTMMARVRHTYSLIRGLSTSRREIGIARKTMENIVKTTEQRERRERAVNSNAPFGKSF